MPINAGRVVCSRTIQVAQFEPKKVDVEVSFVVGDKETFNELLDEAMDIAREAAVGLVKQR